MAGALRTLFAGNVLCAERCCRLEIDLGTGVPASGVCQCHATCTAAGTEEDVDHVLGYCPQWVAERQPIVQVLQEKGMTRR